MRIFIDPSDNVNKFAEKWAVKGQFYGVNPNTLVNSISALDNQGGFSISSFDAPVAGAGWIIMTKSDYRTEEVEDEDGNVITQSVQYGYDILLASNTPFKIGEPIFGYEDDGETPRNLDFFIVSD